MCMAFSDPVFDRVTDPDAWAALPTATPAARTALDLARGFAALARFLRDDQLRYHRGDQPRATPLDPAVANLLRRVETWPLQVQPPPDPEDPEGAAPRAPWPPGYGDWYRTLRIPVWQHLPVQRLWRGVLQCTTTAARLSGEQIAYAQGHRPDPPTAPAELTATDPLAIVHAALLNFPEAVRLAQTESLSEPSAHAPAAVEPLPAPEPDTPIPNPSWQVGLIDRDHVIAWRTEADTIHWWRDARGDPAVFVRPDQAIRAIRANGGSVTLEASGTVGPAPDRVAHAWRQQTVRDAMDAMRRILGADAPPTAAPRTAPARPANAPQWHWQAVNGQDAVLWRTVRQGTQDRVTFLPNPDHPQHAPWRIPLTTAQDPVAAAAFTAETRIQADPTVAPVDAMPASVRQALRVWVDRLRPQTAEPTAPTHQPPAASAPPDDPTTPSASSWELQCVQEGQWVCYRWNAKGRLEWWHPPGAEAPSAATLWDDRQVAQWMADPAHANTPRHSDPHQIPLALAAGLSIRAEPVVAGPRL